MSLAFNYSHQTYCYLKLNQSLTHASSPCSSLRIYTSTGSPLSNVIAESYIDRTPLGVELLLRVAKRGLIDEADISGVPKIISEKSIVVLSKLNADRPSKSICEQWGGLDPIALGAFLIRVMRESKWVQSQDIALTFFARLVLSQRQIPIR